MVAGGAGDGEGSILKTRYFAAGLAGAGALAAVYAFGIEPIWMDWHDEDVEMPGLSAPLDAMRVFHLSDLHLYDGLSAARLEGIIENCNAQNPDLVVLTGDLVNHSPAAIQGCARQLGMLKARWGVLTILGGHDYESWSASRLVRSLEDNGVRVLHNQAVPVGPEESPLWIAGMDDNSEYGAPDMEATLREVPAGAPVLLLMHSPDDIFDAASRSIPLVLAGHTHGGQVCAPFYGPIKTMSRFGKRFARGRHHVRNTVLYVSRGIGSHHHVRFLARPEIVRLTLHTA